MLLLPEITLQICKHKKEFCRFLLHSILSVCVSDSYNLIIVLLHLRRLYSIWRRINVLFAFDVFDFEMKIGIT